MKTTVPTNVLHDDIQAQLTIIGPSLPIAAKTIHQRVQSVS